MSTSAPEAWVDALAEGVVVVRDERVVALNAAAARFLEVDPERAVGAALIAVVRDHRIERSYLDQMPIELFTRGRWLAIGVLEGAMLLRDVSEQRRARDDARELLAVLSHELRTPVTAIRAALEALRYDMPAQQRGRFLEQAEAEADRLVRLLADLTVDVRPPAARSVPLKACARRAVELVAETLAARAVTVRYELPGGDVWADPDKLLQVLLNLIENAAVHGPAEASVRVVATSDPERDGWLHLEVIDQGGPLAPELIEPLFSPHARGARAGGRGTGLGLYVVRSIAERWGGRAWGRPCQAGNAFGVSVPRSRDAALHAALAPSRP